MALKPFLMPWTQQSQVQVNGKRYQSLSARPVSNLPLSVQPNQVFAASMALSSESSLSFDFLSILTLFVSIVGFILLVRGYHHRSSLVVVAIPAFPLTVCGGACCWFREGWFSTTISQYRGLKATPSACSSRAMQSSTVAIILSCAALCAPCRHAGLSS